MRQKKYFIITSLILLFYITSLPAYVYASSEPDPCIASNLSLLLDDKDGYFNGMSHSGTLIVLRNIGSKPCSMPGRPIVDFENSQYEQMPISQRVPLGMNPGPVILPIIIPPRKSVTSEVRWVSNDAYDGHNCLRPDFLTLIVGHEKLRVKFTGQLCGPAGENPMYNLTLFNSHENNVQ